MVSAVFDFSSKHTPTVCQDCTEAGWSTQMGTTKPVDVDQRFINKENLAKCGRKYINNGTKWRRIKWITKKNTMNNQETEQQQGQDDK